MIYTIDIDENELEMILEAIRAQEKKCKGLGNRALLGYGRSDEEEKKREWLIKADEWQELENKIANQTI